VERTAGFSDADTKAAATAGTASAPALPNPVLQACFGVRQPELPLLYQPPLTHARCCKASLCKPGKLQIVVGLLTDQERELLAVRVFSGNPQDLTTVSEQVGILKERFGVQQVVPVGDRGMLKSHGKQALGEVGLRYITALADAKIRKSLKEGTLQMGLFEEQICEVEAERDIAIFCARTRPRLDGSSTGGTVPGPWMD